MAAKDHVIVGVHITNRLKKASDVQGLLTQYGCQIRTRLGLHEASADVCSPSGIIVLELAGDEAKGRELCDRLNAIDGVEVQRMVFGHP